MTDISALEAYAGQLSEAAAKASASSEKQHEYVHGDDETDVQTESGPVPSLAKQAKTIFEYLTSLGTFIQTGLGAVARSWLDKLRDVRSVKDFGAVGNGVADDTAAFVAAQLAYGHALVPTGAYVVDGKQIEVNRLDGPADAVLLYKTGQRVAMERVGNTDALDQLYWQEVQAAPGATLNLNTTMQAMGICEDVLYMTQNVSTPSGAWASDSVVRVASTPMARAATDAVDITVTGGTAPTVVVDLVGLGHGAGASVVREGGELWLYSTVSAPIGQAQIDGVGCNYGTGFSKTKWKGAATVSADVQSFRGLKGVFSAEVCVSADGRYIVLAGYRFLPVVRDTTSYYASIPHVSVFDRAAVEAAGDPTTVVPLYNFPVPYVQSLGDAVGSLSGVACDGEFIYLLNGGAQVVGARSVLVMTLSGELVKAMPVSGWAGTQPELFRKGAGGKQAFAYEIEGLALHDDKLMMLSKFNVCTPSAIQSFQGKNFFPTEPVTGVAPSNFGSWARTEAAAAGAYNPLTAYAAPTALVYHKYLTALAPKGRYTRPHGVADGLYVDCQTPGYQGGYGLDAGYNVYAHFMVGQADRNTDVSWPMLEWRSSGLGRLWHCDQMKTGVWDPASSNGRLSYTYEIGTLISGGPSVATGATLTLTNSRDTSTGDRYGVLHSKGARAMLWGTQVVSYLNLVPSASNSFTLGGPSALWSVIYSFTGAINTSDARLKTPVRQFTVFEIAAAKALAGEIGVYQWLEMIEQKGADGARLHIGMTVQRAIEVMEAHGLDPMRYGFICHDVWEEEPEQWDIEREEDEDGNMVEVSRTLARAKIEAGDRYSVRMDELYAFIAAGAHANQLVSDARQLALEARIEALEGL